MKINYGKWDIELSDEQVKFLKSNGMYDIEDSLDLEDKLTNYIQVH